MPSSSPVIPPDSVASLPTLRNAQEADFDTLVALERDTFVSDRMSPRQWRFHLDNPHARVRVLQLDAEICGASVLFYRRGSGIARLYSMAVARAQRGRGFGELLLCDAIDLARDRGAKEMRLEVREQNASARRLYERHGFTLWRRLPAYYEDGSDGMRLRCVLAG